MTIINITELCISSSSSSSNKNNNSNIITIVILLPRLVEQGWDRFPTPLRAAGVAGPDASSGTQG